LLSQSPLLGYGPASYYLFFPIGVFNWYLQVFLESGLLGIGSLLFLVLVILGAALRSQLPLASFSVIAFAVQMIGMNHYYIPGIWVLTAFLFVRIAERKFSLQKKSAFRLQPVHTA
jgi:O-antigen ligase